MNSIDDLTIPCVKKQDSADDDIVVHVKAEENGMFPFNKIHQLGCRTLVRSCSSWPDYEKNNKYIHMYITRHWTGNFEIGK